MKPSTATAHALAQRLQIHHTPQHGSWLNVAEIKLSRLTRQCLDRRLGDLDTLNAELKVWQNATNNDQRQVEWHFTTPRRSNPTPPPLSSRLEATVY
jgi:hypothetical protein